MSLSSYDSWGLAKLGVLGPRLSDYPKFLRPHDEDVKYFSGHPVTFCNSMGCKLHVHSDHKKMQWTFIDFLKDFFFLKPHMICSMQKKGMLSYPVCLGAKRSVRPTRHPDFIHWNLISIQIKHLTPQLLSMFQFYFWTAAFKCISLIFRGKQNQYKIIPKM